MFFARQDNYVAKIPIGWKLLPNKEPENITKEEFDRLDKVECNKMLLDGITCILYEIRMDD